MSEWAISSSVQTKRLATPFLRMAILFAALLIFIALYLTWDMKAGWEFTLRFRGKKLLTLLLVGFSISSATLLFQTISHNRILTPGILGFDALYVLLQSLLIMTLGVIGFNSFNPYSKWILETSLMMGAMFLLFRLMFRGHQQSLQLLMLAGIIMGALFSSASALIFRLLDPTQFDVLQDSLFASFGSVQPTLLSISMVVIALTIGLLFRYHHQLDVLLLGRDAAINLGIAYKKMVGMTLMIVALLVSLSTALVGPVSFFGLLVVHLAYRFSGSYRHAILLPFAALLGMLTLVLGEFVLQHVAQFNTRLSIIIEFVGGIFFLALILKQGRT